MRIKNGYQDAAQGVAASVAGAVDTARATVSREFHDLLSDIEQLIAETTSLTGAELATARARIGERIAAARESVESLGGTISQRARQGALATNEYVHEEPWKAIGISAAVGVLIGIAVTRR